MNQNEDKSTPKILVIDDDPGVLKVITELLNNAGYIAVGAKDGRDALKKLFTDPTWGEGKFPDLLIVDIMMPEMDGFQLCERVKNNPATRHIPFIFLTAKFDSETKAKAYLLGCFRYLVKPSSRKELLRSIDSCLKDRDQTRTLLAESNILG